MQPPNRRFFCGLKYMKEFENIQVKPGVENFVPWVDLGITADLYAEIFAGPPWNEYTNCGGCKKFFGLQTKPGDNCGSCGMELALAYPFEETKEYIIDETSRNNSSVFLMKKNDELVGFVWGYSYDSTEDFVKEKYRTPEMQSKIKDVLAQNNVAQAFYYFSECGIRIDQRGNGFSNTLSGLLIQEGRKTKLPIVMRTNWESPMVAIAQRFGMTQIMGPLTEIDKNEKRVLLKNGSVNNLRDSEIKERVLFVLK